MARKINVCSKCGIPAMKEVGDKCKVCGGTIVKREERK